MKRLARYRRWQVVVAALVILGFAAALIDWPVPATYRERILAQAGRRLERPIACASLRWSLLRGVTLREFAIGSEQDSTRLIARSVRIHNWLPWRVTDFTVAGPTVRILRDTAARLQLPWPVATGSDRPERIAFDDGTIHYEDVPLGMAVDLVQAAGVIEPRRQQGRVTAQFGETLPLALAVTWSGAEGRLDLGELSESWLTTHESTQTRITFRPATEASGLAGGFTVAPKRFAAEARGAIPGSLLTPWLAGARISDSIALDFTWQERRGRFVAESRSGTITGVPAFKRLAARPGLERFAEPRYDLLQARAQLVPGRITVEAARFEGEGLGLRFSGTIVRLSVSGQLVALFTPELAARIPELARVMNLLDRENGRVKVVFTVSGPLGSPHLEPVLPALPRLLWRGAKQLWREGGDQLVASLKALARIFQ